MGEGSVAVPAGLTRALFLELAVGALLDSIGTRLVAAAGITAGVMGALQLSGMDDDGRVTRTQALAGGEERNGPTPTSRKAVVASGSHRSTSWSVIAYHASEERSPDVSDRSFCFEIEWEPSLDPGPQCFVGLQAGLGDVKHFFATSVDQPEGPSLFFGLVKKGIGEVRLELEDGSVEEARIERAARDLGVPFDFFVGFAPNHSDVFLVASSKDGRVLEREAWPAMPLLTIDRTGTGDGTVVGYRTGEYNCPSCEEREPVIDCGSQCSIELDGASLTLEARPADGSVFAGWGGDCFGSGATCTIVVDEDAQVEAAFVSPD